MDFAFLVHARDHTDIQRKYKITKYLPKQVVEFFCLYWPPIIVSKITSLKDKNNENITGWIIGIPMTAKQILNNRKKAKTKVIKAILIAKKLGAKIVGLGALTSPVTNGGLDLVEKVDLKMTTGNALTAAVAIKHIQEIIKNNDIKKIAIVGGTGSIGSGVSKILISKYPEKEYKIFARTKENLDKLINELNQISSKTRTAGYCNNLEELVDADLIIVATSASGAIVKSQHLKKHAIVYDVTQPRNVSDKTIKQRQDVSFYEGGHVKIRGLNDHLPFGLPPKIGFACFAETVLLAMENYQKNFSLGKTDTKKILYISKLTQKYNFQPEKLKRNKI